MDEVDIGSSVGVDSGMLIIVDSIPSNEVPINVGLDCNIEVTEDNVFIKLALINELCDVIIEILFVACRFDIEMIGDRLLGIIETSDDDFVFKEVVIEGILSDNDFVGCSEYLVVKTLPLLIIFEIVRDKSTLGEENELL